MQQNSFFIIEKIKILIFLPRQVIRKKACWLLGHSRASGTQSWPLSLFFFYFFNSKKGFFAFFIELIWLGVGFLYREGAEIGYQLDFLKMQKIIFYCWKNSKIPKVPSSDLHHGREPGQGGEDPGREEARPPGEGLKAFFLLIFSTLKNDIFGIFDQVDLTGSVLVNSSCYFILYSTIKNAILLHFYQVNLTGSLLFK